jgi:cell division protein FtsB
MRKVLKKISSWSLFLLFFLFGLTLFRIGLLSKEVVLVDSMEKEIAQLSKENQRLEDEALSLNSISNLDQFLENSNFVKGEKVKFIQILEGRVVAK